MSTFTSGSKHRGLAAEGERSGIIRFFGCEDFGGRRKFFLVGFPDEQLERRVLSGRSATAEIGGERFPYDGPERLLFLQRSRLARSRKTVVDRSTVVLMATMLARHCIICIVDVTDHHGIPSDLSGLAPPFGEAQGDREPAEPAASESCAAGLRAPPAPGRTRPRGR